MEHSHADHREFITGFWGTLRDTTWAWMAPAFKL